MQRMNDLIDCKVVREDWIGRFFGYLGSMEYMRSKGYFGKAALWEELGKKANNIVFIYSGYKEGISFYMRKLIEELHTTGEYACCSYNFSNSACTGNCITKRTRTTVVQIGYMIHATRASAGSIASESFGTGECQLLCLQGNSCAHQEGNRQNGSFHVC